MFSCQQINRKVNSRLEARNDHVKAETKSYILVPSHTKVSFSLSFCSKKELDNWVISVIVHSLSDTNYSCVDKDHEEHDN
jgi:hypothetical protein